MERTDLLLRPNNNGDDDGRDGDGNRNHNQELDSQNARKHARLERFAEREREIDVAAIKEQYLGSKKKRAINPTDKLRISFDLDNSADTSRDLALLYGEARPLFGRGFKAGIQRRWSRKVLDEMSERDWKNFMDDFNISYVGSNIPRPMRSWAENKLRPELLEAVEKAGYDTPSPIQVASIPLGLERRDVIGIARSGSGKTAAFVLPMLDYVAGLPRIISEENEAAGVGPYAIVMAPTREVAQRVEDETVKFARCLGIKVVSVVDGRSVEEQGFKLRQGCEVVIATPGCLVDCLERRYAVLNRCNYVVLDEADRMIDMGFERQVVGVLDAMPNMKPENEDEEVDEKRVYRTTCMFGATMSSAVERLAGKYLRNPVVVSIGALGKANYGAD